MKKLMSAVLVLTLLFALSACDRSESGTAQEAPASESERLSGEEAESNDGSQGKDEGTKAPEHTGEQQQTEKGENEMSTHPVVTISTKIGDKELQDMKLELYPEKAPKTVANFVSLAQEGYYDGLIFHRIIAGFMIQGGDPTGTGMGGPGHQIYGEFANNGFQANDIKHERGVISMARSQMPDSAGSQFFICHQDALFLDGEYAAFGKLIEGEESLDALATVETGAQDRPKQDCVISKITVELNGYEVPASEK